TAVFPDRLIRSDQSQEPSSKVPGRSHCHRPSKLSLTHTLQPLPPPWTDALQPLCQQTRHTNYSNTEKERTTSTQSECAPVASLLLENRQVCGGKVSVDLDLTLRKCTYTGQCALTQGLHPDFIAEIYPSDFTPTAALTSQCLRGPGGRSSSTDWAKSNRANHLEKKKKRGISRKIPHSCTSNSVPPVQHLLAKWSPEKLDHMLTCSVSLLLGWPLPKPWARSAALLTLTLGLPVAKRASGKFSFAQSAGIESQIHAEAVWWSSHGAWSWSYGLCGGWCTIMEAAGQRLSEKCESAKGDHKEAQIFIQAPGSLLRH
ncbi:hypothetical protein KUCAC02_023738, partial [Chaenocephalus aceratus]